MAVDIDLATGDLVHQSTQYPTIARRLPTHVPASVNLAMPPKVIHVARHWVEWPEAHQAQSPVAAQVGRDDVALVTQCLRHPVSVPAVIAPAVHPAVHQQQRRRGGLSQST